MENLKIFLISVFTCTSRKEIKERRERQRILKYYVDNKKKRRYQTFDSFSNEKSANNLPDEEYID
jgi:hypothetical protein